MKKNISIILIVMVFIWSIAITWWGTSVNSYTPDEIEDEFYRFRDAAIADSILRPYDAFIINGDTLFQEAIQSPQMFGETYIGRINVKEPKLKNLSIKNFVIWLKEN